MRGNSYLIQVQEFQLFFLLGLENYIIQYFK